MRNVLTSLSLSDDAVATLVANMVKRNEFAKRAWPTCAMGEDVLEEAEGTDVLVLVIAGEKDIVETLERLKKEVLGN